MKRKWNWPIWVGFIFVGLAGFFSYPFFAQFPITRDFPWANFLLLGIGGAFLLVGLIRAFGQPQTLSRQNLWLDFTAIVVLLFAFFAYEIFYELRQVRLPTGAPRVGEKAPEFTLPDQNGKQVALADLLLAERAVDTNFLSRVLVTTL